MPLILAAPQPIHDRSNHDISAVSGIPEHVAAKAEGHPSAVLGVDGSEWPVAGRLANTATKPLNLSRDRQEQLRRLAATGEPVRELAAAFGIGRATAYSYLAGGRSGQTGT